MDASLEVLHRVTSSTVTLAVEVPDSHPSVAVLGTQRFGTGAVVDHDGRILTVNYIVLGADTVTATDADGNDHQARMVAQDFFTGVAVLAIEPGVLAPLPAGDSSALRTGQDVFSVASVGGSERRAGCGFISSLEPFDAYWEYLLDRAVWVSMINPGLGGGPLCNTNGQLVGIASLNLGAVGRSTLAIPSEHYYDYADEFLVNGRRVTRPDRAWLGMFCYALPDRTVVAGLIPGGPGESSGLVVGDVIVSLNTRQVTGRPELYEQLWEHSPGDVVELRVFRSGKLANISIKAGDAEDFFSF